MLLLVNLPAVLALVLLESGALTHLEHAAASHRLANYALGNLATALLCKPYLAIAVAEKSEILNRAETKKSPTDAERKERSCEIRANE